MLFNNEISITSTPELKILNGVTQEIVDGKAVWKLNAPNAGEYKINYQYNTEEYSQNVLITTEKTYSTPEKVISDSKLKKITNGNKVVHPFGES